MNLLDLQIIDSSQGVDLLDREMHIITECDAFSALRRNIFQTLGHIDLTKVTDHQLGRFISESNYRWFNSKDEPEDPG